MAGGSHPSAVQGEGFNAGLGTGKIGREMYMLEQGRNISPFNMSLAWNLYFGSEAETILALIP